MCNKIALIAFILCFVLLHGDKTLQVFRFITSSIKALWKQAYTLENVVVFCTGLAFIHKTSPTTVSLEMNRLYSDNSVAL